MSTTTSEARITTRDLNAALDLDGTTREDRLRLYDHLGYNRADHSLTTVLASLDFLGLTFVASVIA